MEWLEADNQGGFASGTTALARTRRYHALLLTATTPPTGRVVLVNGIEAWVDMPSGRFFLSAQHYAPDTMYPDGADRIATFSHDPWPAWTFRLPDGTTLRQEIVVDPDAGETLLRWQGGPCRLSVRPLLSGRDYHSLHRENAAFAFAATVRAGNVAWRPYPGLPAIAALTNGAYTHGPQWYRNFLYTAERDRGLDCIEDLASPGTFTFDLAAGDAVMILRAGDGLSVRAASRAARVVDVERARRTGPALTRAADAYFADRDAGRTLIAGFPWFTDWGRDTFIAMRGLALGTGRVAEAEAILSQWADTVSEGMLPNRFPDASGAPEYNAVDASLWFVVAVHDLLAAGATKQRDRLTAAVEAILTGYQAGTRFGIGADADGLLRAGVPGVQLTWMDAKVGDHVIT
ncbi:MAG: glycogen debranching enzyme N-terminal domain-containing protein, partial [Acetobacteraceae bacterium]